MGSFNAPHDEFFGKTNLFSISYTCLPGVENFPILVEVTSLCYYMACAIGFPLYYFGYPFSSPFLFLFSRKKY